MSLGRITARRSGESTAEEGKTNILRFFVIIWGFRGQEWEFRGLLSFGGWLRGDSL